MRSFTIENRLRFYQKTHNSVENKEDVSEYKMSIYLGHNRSYIQAITSGNYMPPMSEFLRICDYLNVTPAEFFNAQEMQYSILIQKAIEGMQKLSDDDLLALIQIINQLGK